jgi:hypothetical protein
MEVNQTQALTATGLRGDNSKAKISAGLTWKSSDPQVATINDSGVVTGIAAGQATVTASSAGKIGTTVVTVTDVAIPSSISISPESITLPAGITEGISVVGHYAGGYSLRIKSGLTFSSSAEEIATVTAQGTVTGLAAGSATITANALGLSAEVVVTVGSPCPTKDRGLPGVQLVTDFIPFDINTDMTDPSKFGYFDFLVNGCEYEHFLGFPSTSGAYRGSFFFNVPETGAGNNAYRFAFRQTGGAVLIESDPVILQSRGDYAWFVYGHPQSLQQTFLNLSSNPENDLPPPGKDRVWVINMDSSSETIDLYSWRNKGTELGYRAFEDVPYGTTAVRDLPSGDMDWFSTTQDAASPGLAIFGSYSAWGRTSLQGIIAALPPQVALGYDTMTDFLPLHESPITVSSDSVQPVYSWETGNVQQLLVMRGSKDKADYVWGIRTSSGEDLASPVTHGSVPEGADILYPEVTLTLGTQYTIEIIGINTDRWWTATFTP